MLPKFDEISCLISDDLGSEVSIEDKTFYRTNPDQGGFFMFGPYVSFDPGLYRVTFDLSIHEVPAGRIGDPVIVTLDVATNMGGTVLVERSVRLSEATSVPTRIAIDVQVRGSRELEFRACSTGQVSLLVAPRVTVEKIQPRHHLPVRKSALVRSWDNEREFLDGFLRNISGVIHIGANTGQERFLYQLSGVDVLWVEAIPAVYEELLDHISGLDRQRAVNALLTDVDGEVYTFNVSNYGGGSSSILPFEQHAETMPHIRYIEQISLTSTTFATMIEREQVTLEDYQALVIDAEGAELLILQAAYDLLSGFRYIKCEVSDFPLRTGSPTAEQLDALLAPLGFEQLVRKPHGYGTGNNGTFWDVVWKQRWAGEPLHYPEVALPFIATRTWERLGT